VQPVPSMQVEQGGGDEQGPALHCRAFGQVKKQRTTYRIIYFTYTGVVICRSAL
jgi:hypothetical protein